jgi:hypothetical protein
MDDHICRAVRFANEHLENVYDSADNPLDVSIFYGAILIYILPREQVVPGRHEGLLAIIGCM